MASTPSGRAISWLYSRWKRWPQYLDLCDTLSTVENAESSAKPTAHWFREPSACLEIMRTLGVKMLSRRLLLGAALP
ncbi:hypothetical protein EYF80_030673 [Liparis tanakae]|uniref:Uncharacterized protein n=1 Tax=Liparis tanakae TaxID=230148 RepID=A0A4Z2H056_9TELE|nr:hypothetical protein EYF80_030673 [Liparis tanakae]